jgi:hypothetical protein
MLAAQQALNNDSVIKLVKAGLSDDLIISTINASQGEFDTSVDGILALKAGGASDKIVSAVLLKGTAATRSAATPVPSAPQTLQDPNDPMSPHEPGIYLMIASGDGASKMILLAPAPLHTKESIGLGTALTMGIASQKIRAYLSGDRASIRTRGGRPEFYIYYPSAGAIGLSNSIARPSEQFDLHTLEVEKGQRVTKVARTTFGGGISHPKPDGQTIIFTTELIRPNAFKLILKTDLGPGEYAFTEMEARETGSGGGMVYYQTFTKAFDFGID